MAGILKVDTIQNSSAENIITQTNSTTLTIGTSGDTVTLAAGATSSGFGRTGAVNWDTTPKTTTVTAVSGVGYFVNTTSGAITVNLPSTPSAGDIVGITDYAGTAATNNITINRNGSNVEGLAENPILNTNRDTITLIYVDSTQGWLPIADNTGATILPKFVTATGGTITTCGNYKIHTFTGPGTFTVSCAGNTVGSSKVDYLVVAGGGAGGQGKAANGGGSGGGAGGFRESVPSPAAWTASPLANPGGALPVSVTGYPITVGAGGGPGSGCGLPGSNSIFSTITSAGGGGGGGGQSPDNGQDGGSGAGRNLGNTPPVSPSQGSNGGIAGGGWGGGGGGATGVGGVSPNYPSPTDNYGAGGVGGVGATTSISGSPIAYAGGGGGGGYSGGGTPQPNAGGLGSPCGTGGRGNPVANGTTNRGGGGGGNGGGDGISNAPHGLGGSGIVIIRYKYQ